MSQQIGAPGQPLPIGQFSNPYGLYSAPVGLPGNTVMLQPGENVVIPPGNYLIDPGLYSFIQFYDPLTTGWRTQNSSSRGLRQIVSDGFNVRVANLLGCPVGAIVTDGGDGDWVQSTTTVTPSVGNSTWQAIVGGMCSVVSIASAGSGYGIPPLVLIDAPPSPGVQATAYASIQTGTVSGVTLTNVGAGYQSVPTVRISPNPTDPNISSGITDATVSIALVGGTPTLGSIAAIICTNPGVSVASVPTLTIAGAGTGSPAATAVRLTALTGLTVNGAGDGFTYGAGFVTYGGRPSATPLYTNPATDFSTYVPRNASGALAIAGASLVSVSAIYDGGIFAGTPAVAVLNATGGLQTTAASVSATYGTYNDTVIVQPAP